MMILQRLRSRPSTTSRKDQPIVASPAEFHCCRRSSGDITLWESFHWNCRAQLVSEARQQRAGKQVQTTSKMTVSQAYKHCPEPLHPVRRQSGRKRSASLSTGCSAEALKPITLLGVPSLAVFCPLPPVPSPPASSVGLPEHPQPRAVPFLSERPVKCRTLAV